MNTPKAGPPCPGVPPQDFEAALRALVELRDSGRLLIHLTRRNAVRLVGDLGEFRAQFSKRRAGGEIEMKHARQAWHEIRALLSARAVLGDAEFLPDFLLDMLFRVDLDQSGDSEKEQVREYVKAKVDQVAVYLLTAPIEDRSARLKTTTGRSIEDIDSEIVSQRHDRVSERQVASPFLRLRLRYSEGTSKVEKAFPGLVPSAVMSEDSTVPSFELECDDSDIDLLLYRLKEAKELLASFRNQGRAEAK